MLYLLAILTAKPGMRDALLAEVNAVVPASLAEKGCLEYCPTIDVEGWTGRQNKLGPDTLVLVEKYESVEALNEHIASPHIRSYQVKSKDLIESRVIYMLTPP